MLRHLVAGLLLCGLAAAFECQADTILRLATNHRTKDLETECHREKTNTPCSEQKDADAAWKEFEKVQEKYKKAVAECVAIRKGAPKKRHAEKPHNDDPTDPNVDHTGHDHRVKRDHDPTDPDIDHSGHNHRMRRHKDHDPSDPSQDHSGHNHRMRRERPRHQPDDPMDPTIDHTGHNHRIRREHDPNDPNVDHTGHNHRARREHDPNDPDIDHTGHDHRMKRDHDPKDPNVDHTGHNHRRRRHDDHDATDPNVDHTGHNHRRRRRDVDDHLPHSEPERPALRSRRQVCQIKGKEALDKLADSFKDHCDRENICLPDEDLPEGSKRDEIKEIQKLRAKKYAEYLTHVAMCKA